MTLQARPSGQTRARLGHHRRPWLGLETGRSRRAGPGVVVARLTAACAPASSIQRSDGRLRLDPPDAR